MRKKLILIALDAADIDLIKLWSSEGFLPNFDRILRNSSLIKLEGNPVYRNESSWVSSLTGCTPEQTGYWTPIKYNPGTYKVKSIGAYSFDPFLPIHALVPDLKVNVFDLPHCGQVFQSIKGNQILGWGAHSPMCNPISYPPDIIGKIKKEFGLHPALKIQNRGSWWDNLKLRNLYYSLIKGVKKRGEIIRMLLNKHHADLNIFTFGELHIAGHHFWHLNNKTHPAFASNNPPLPDFLKDIYQAVDDELGKLTDVLTGSEDLILFSPEGGDVNWCDLNSMVFLPEFLFRWNFPGEKLIPGDESNTTQTPVIPETMHWVKSVWNDSFKNLPPAWVPGIFKNIFQNLADIDTINFPFYILRRLGDLQWQPSLWYKPWWTKMKAFALPSYGDGYIRINLKGREPDGIVLPEEKNTLIKSLTEMLMGLTDPDTGESLVEDIIIRNNVSIHREQPDADLIVNWKRKANDKADGKDLGRIGPLPFWKSGSHKPTGFIAGHTLDPLSDSVNKTAHIIDMVPTILDLLGITRPDYLKGKPLFKRRVTK